MSPTASLLMKRSTDVALANITDQTPRPARLQVAEGLGVLIARLRRAQAAKLVKLLLLSCKEYPQTRQHRRYMDRKRTKRHHQCDRAFQTRSSMGYGALRQDSRRAARV